MVGDARPTLFRPDRIMLRHRGGHDWQRSGGSVAYRGPMMGL
jgi:hypothetical protein